MMFGDPKQFAIELALNDNYGVAWLFGRFSYWICGTCVGNYNLGASLRDVRFLLEGILPDRGKRSHSELWALSPEQICRRLTDGMYGEAGSEEDICRGIEQQYARHDICPAIDVFDDWRVYLVEDESLGRCIYHRINSNHYEECRLRRGQFDEVASQAVDYLDSLLVRQLV